MIDAVFAGVYVPLWSGPTVTTPFRGKKRYDGAFRVPLPCPLGNTTYCIRVSVLPPWDMDEVAREARDPAIRPYIADWWATTLGSNPPAFLARSLWEQAKKPGQQPLNEVAAGWFAFFSHQPPAGEVDIYPGAAGRRLAKAAACLLACCWTFQRALPTRGPSARTRVHSGAWRVALDARSRPSSRPRRPRPCRST